MKDLIKVLKTRVFPKATEKEKEEIDKLNVAVLRRISFLCAILESFACLTALFKIVKTQNILISVLSTAFAAVLCLAMNITLRVMDRKKYYNHTVVVTICNSFSVLFILWSMYVSAREYMLGLQVATFYAVIFALIAFTVMIPRMGFSIVAASFIGFYLCAYHINKAADIQTFNYIALMLICFGCTAEKYSVTISKINEKIKTEELNGAYIDIMRHDPLSKAKNRTALIEDLPEYFGKKIIVLIFDLDNFKTLNDTYGHISGDRVISSYAKVFCDVFGKESVYRYGGDEFLVVRKATTEEAFNSEIKALRETVDNLEIEGIKEKTDYSLGYSFGIVEDGSEFEELIIKADDVMYEQKREKH